VASILSAAGLVPTADAIAADVTLLMTCSIREKAEARVAARLVQLRAERAAARPSRRAVKRAAREEARGRGAPPRPLTPPAPPPLLGVLGCMAERVRGRLVAGGLADVVAGPDAYRGLPGLVAAAASAQRSRHGPARAPLQPPPAAAAAAVVDTSLSLTETYADIVPARAPGSVSARLTISRGCDSHCAFCVVPHTRGAERSRPLGGLVAEAARLFHEEGVREVTLLGQNVTSWVDWSGAGPGAQAAARAAARALGPARAAAAAFAPGFTSALLPVRGAGTPAAAFPDLVAAIAAISPELRVRFSSPHPRDFTPALIAAVASTPNVARAIHLPAQSGSSAVLARMGRGYSREAYDGLVASVRAALPRVGLSTDVIVGFCGETAGDHEATLGLLRAHAFDAAYLFAYSTRPRTKAARVLQDDVPAGLKAARLAEVVAVFRGALAERSAAEVGRVHLVLVDGPARRGGGEGGDGGGDGAAALLTGRTSTGRRVLFPPPGGPPTSPPLRPGAYAAVRVMVGLPGSLRGEVVSVVTAEEWFSAHGGAAWVEEGEGGGERSRAA